MPLASFLDTTGNSALNDRYAVLVAGSNGCPGRLSEKFGAVPNTCIVVLAGRISGVDSVYTSTLTENGILPATVIRAPDTDLQTHVTLLSQQQLEIMNISEDLENMYSLVRLDTTFRNNSGIGPTYAYFARDVLLVDEHPIRLSALSAIQPQFPAMTEREVLANLLDRLGFQLSATVEKRHNDLVSSPHLRRELQSRIARDFVGLDPAFQPGRQSQVSQMEPAQIVG